MQRILVRFVRWIVGVGTVLLLFAVSVYPAAAILDGHRATFLFMGVIALVFIVICIFVHELGHAVAAWLAGWRVHIIVVASFAYAPRSKRFLRMRNQSGYKDLCGWVHATPPSDSQWENGYISYVLGGIAGNLLLAALATLLALAMYELQPRVFAVLTGLAAVSVLFAVANLVPSTLTGAWKNDGATLIAALRGERPSLRDQKIARLLGMAYDGVPAQNWDVSVMSELIEDSPDEAQPFDPLLISYAFATADLAMAKLVLGRFLDANPDGYVEYRCMYAFALAMVDRDARHAVEILDKLPGRPAKKSFSFWRAKAVAAHLLERREAALEAARKARRVAGKIGVSPDEDDEAILQAIEQCRDLPHLQPRGRLSAAVEA